MKYWNIYVIFVGLASTSVPLQCVICVSGTSKLCVSGTTLNIPLSQPVHFILAQRDFVCSVSTEGRSSREAALSLVNDKGVNNIKYKSNSLFSDFLLCFYTCMQLYLHIIQHPGPTPTFTVTLKWEYKSFSFIEIKRSKWIQLICSGDCWS